MWGVKIRFCDFYDLGGTFMISVGNYFLILKIALFIKDQAQDLHFYFRGVFYQPKLF